MSLQTRSVASWRPAIPHAGSGRAARAGEASSSRAPGAPSHHPCARCPHPARSSTTSPATLPLQSFPSPPSAASISCMIGGGCSQLCAACRCSFQTTAPLASQMRGRRARSFARWSCPARARAGGGAPLLALSCSHDCSASSQAPCTRAHRTCSAPTPRRASPAPTRALATAAQPVGTCGMHPAALLLIAQRPTGRWCRSRAGA
mmetsp:Transcript_34546/g.71313  ORF Transcript_34546/g.71313 Transcript_34546/m.71313 type:complete len:204 (-) Transcript_34546:449-1060(-)